MTARPLRTAVIIQRPDESLVFAPYEVGQIMKFALPRSGDRRWDPLRRCWVIEPRAADYPEVILVELCDHVELIDTTPPPPQRACHSGAEHLLRDLPARLRRPAALALVKVLHPDVGGDHEAMVALNAAMERAS